MNKKHLPGCTANELGGTALCGRYARYGTGDHRLIRQLALSALAQDDYMHYCIGCIAVLRKQEEAV